MENNNSKSSEKMMLNQTIQSQANIKNHIIKIYQELTKYKDFISVKDFKGGQTTF